MRQERLIVARPGPMPLSYRLARGFVIACGALLVVATVLAHALVPELLFDRGPVPSWRERLPGMSAELGYGLLLALPYRWTLSGWPFRFRFALLGFASIWLVIAASTGVEGFFAGRQHWLVLPVSALALALAVLAPGTLFVRRGSAQRAASRSSD